MLQIILIVLPVFAVLFVGTILKPMKLIDDNFITYANKLIFNLCLPVLLFRKISVSDLKSLSFLNSVILMLICVLVVCVFSYFTAKVFKENSSGAATISMNSFRANYAYMGLPVSGYAFGDEGLVIASVLMAFIVPLVNLISVSVLSFGTGEGSKKRFLKNTILNPLAIACVLGLGFSYLEIGYPNVMGKTLEIISGVTLPLALFCVGASLKFETIGKHVKPVMLASIFKLIILPLLTFAALKITGTQIGLTEKVLIIMLAAPSATVNYVMARELGGTSESAATTIAFNTTFSIITFSIWLWVLSLI